MGRNLPLMTGRERRNAPWNEEPKEIPVCLLCEDNDVQAHCHWDGRPNNGSAYCEFHGELDEHEFRTEVV